MRTSRTHTALMIIGAIALSAWLLDIAVAINELIDNVALLIVEMGGKNG